MGIVLGIVVGAGAVAVIAATDSSGGAHRTTTRPTPPPGPKIVITVPNAPGGGGGAPMTVNVQLPPLTGRGRGYRLGDQPPAGAIERLAAAVGVHGEVQSDAGG